jgi:alpha-beta hydrolase superfamily lysophospholipase
MIIILLAFVLMLPVSDQDINTITFPSGDGVTVTADVYMAQDKSAPFIVLFHQANWSRGEYLEIGPKLNQLGYNCMAVDLRSGGRVNNIQNLTAVSAVKAMKETKYVDAYQDIEAAMKYARDYFAEGKLIIWGSSYSSALVLRYAGDNTNTANAVDGVLSFSPGEYFRSQGKPADYVTQGAKKINIPVFITSAKGEKASWWNIYQAIPSTSKHYFLPQTPGNHGSRALWAKFGDSLTYWDEVSAFLTTIK